MLVVLFSVRSLQSYCVELVGFAFISAKIVSRRHGPRQRSWLFARAMAVTVLGVFRDCSETRTR